MLEAVRRVRRRNCSGSADICIICCITCSTVIAISDNADNISDDVDRLRDSADCTDDKWSPAAEWMLSVTMLTTFLMVWENQGQCWLYWWQVISCLCLPNAFVPVLSSQEVQQVTSDSLLWAVTFCLLVDRLITVWSAITDADVLWHNTGFAKLSSWELQCTEFWQLDDPRLLLESKHTYCDAQYLAWLGRCSCNWWVQRRTEALDKCQQHAQVSTRFSLTMYVP